MRRSRHAPDGGLWTSPKGAAWVRRRYQWLYVFGFVRPDTGETWWALVPTVHTQAMRTVLAAFARDTGIDAMHRVVLVLDGAGWHRSRKLVVPEGIDLVFLPRHPQGCGRWSTNRSPTGRPPIQRHTLFHWWPIHPVAGIHQ